MRHSSDFPNCAANIINFSQRSGNDRLTVTFESFVRNMNGYIQFGELLFQYPGCFVDDLVTAFTAGNTTQQQEVFKGAND